MKQNLTVRHGALDGVEVFLAVARHRSFRQASTELGVSPSAVSQAVRTLEARIGAGRFLRTTRSVGLSEAGERFLARARPAFEELVAAGESARALGERPSGLLRLSVPRAVVSLVLEPRIASFCLAWPDVEVEIAASDELIDLAAQGFDAGVRLGQLIAPDMIAVRLTPEFRFVVVASPAYLDRMGRPERPDALRRHACLRIANDFSTLLGAARKGRGLALLPEPVAAESLRTGQLVPVLEPFAPVTPGIFLYYPGRRQVMPKLRAFIDHVRGRSSGAAAP